MIIGIFLAGVLHLILNEKNIIRFIGNNGKLSVIKAALFGVPLPLCSCSVLPVAKQLRSSGLSNSGTTSFLISTPETGVDSILLTYSLTDPIMTVARPIAAFVTAVSAGLAVGIIDDEPAIDGLESKSECSDCCSSTTNNTEVKTGFLEKVKEMFRYSIFNLLNDLAPYLFIGYLLAGLVAVFLGDDMLNLPASITSGWGSYVGAIVVGLPMYICATSSTPLAAVLLASGFTPGAVLLFLLVGPATNIATLTVVRHILKIKATVIYLGSIIVLSVLCGLTLDYIYNLNGYDVSFTTSGDNQADNLLSIVSAGLLRLYITIFSFRKYLKRLF